MGNGENGQVMKFTMDSAISHLSVLFHRCTIVALPPWVLSIL